MTITKCPECGHDVSTEATVCPNCGYPLKNKSEGTNKQVAEYEFKVVKISTFGRSENSLNEKLDVYFKQGWEVSTMVEDAWLGGVLSPVYKITLKRKIN